MKKYPIELGTLLYTMVEPHKGHEVEYNRWYERDHFYGGVLVGEYSFAGDRFVCMLILDITIILIISP